MVHRTSLQLYSYLGSVERYVLGKVLSVSKKFNHKDKLNNFAALPGESVSSFWKRFSAFVRGIPNHHTNDESPKEYFYRGKDCNKKAMLDAIAGGSYGECTYDEIAKKLREDISQQKGLEN